MAIQIGLGISNASDSFQAARYAASQAQHTIEKGLPCLGIVFSTIDYQPNLVAEGIYSVLPNIKIVGSSGVCIISPQGITQHAVAIMLICSEKMHFIVDAVKSDKEIENFYTIGHDFAYNMLKMFKTQQRDFLLFFADGTHLNMSEIISGIYSCLGTSFPIIGGISSNGHSKRSFQYCNREAYFDNCVGVLCKLGSKFSYVAKHGWKPLGRPRLITKANNNLLIEIEGRPAADIYEDYFGAEHIADLKQGANSLMSLLYPLGIYKAGEKEYLLRNIVDVKEGGILVCQGDVHENEEIRLMIGNKNSCLATTQSALTEAIGALKTTKPKAAIIFDSVLRAKLLGRNINEEVEIIKKTLGEDIPFIGFYSYGEYVPLESISYQGHASLHNGTFFALLLGE